MSSLIDRIRRLIAMEQGRAASLASTRETASGSGPAANSEASFDEESLTRLMHLIEQTKLSEYTCQETLDLLDEYAELAANHQDAEKLMPLVKGHLEHCVDCTDRYETLVRILESS